MVRKKQEPEFKPYVRMRFPAHVELRQQSTIVHPTSSSVVEMSVLAATIEDGVVNLTAGHSDALNHMAFVNMSPDEMECWCQSMLALIHHFQDVLKAELPCSI